MAAQCEMLRDRSRRTVVRVCQHYVAKFGTGVDPHEGVNALFVARMTQLPVPKVYALFRGKTFPSQNFIVEEYIDGTRLKDAWHGQLDPGDKYRVTAQLRAQMEELRAVPAPGFYGGLAGQQLRDPLLQRTSPNQPDVYPDPDPAIAGPHDSEEDFTDAMVQVAKHNYLHQAGSGAPRPVFTHAAFRISNIILRPDGTPVIIDWETAGWCPDYWEFCTALGSLNQPTDWHYHVAGILDPYYNELGWMKAHMDMAHDD